MIDSIEDRRASQDRVVSPPPARAIDVEASGHIESVFRDLGIALAVASYQASSLVLISTGSAGLSVLPRTFDKPMSLAAADGRLAVATRGEVVVLAASNALAPGYPRAPDTYARLWLPRTVRFTGEIDLHDIAFSGDTLVGAATRFSCLASLDDSASFTPAWQPPFVSALMPQDRCHLNGLALDAAGRPRFVTALGATDTPEGWRDGRCGGGVLVSVPDGRVVLNSLCMPHSPRLIDGELYLLNSGAGEVLRLDADGRPQVLTQLPGYTRGLACKGDILFVGLSQLRDRKGAGRAALPVEATGPLSCGVVAVDRRSGETLGSLTFTAGIEEISDLALLAGAGRHGLLNHYEAGHRAALALPDRGFWAQAGSSGTNSLAG